MAGDGWPQRAREAACILSGEGHDASSVNVELLSDIRQAFGDLDVIRSIDLVAELTKDPERPWVEWRHGKPLTQKQLGGLLAPFGITSETVSIPGLADAKGYRRIRFNDAWDAYVPGQNTSASPTLTSETSKRRYADTTGFSGDFRSVAEAPGDASKKGTLSYSHGASDASTDRKSGIDAKGCLTTIPPPPDDVPKVASELSSRVTTAVPCGRQAEPDQTRAPVETPKSPWDDLDIPDYLRRSTASAGDIKRRQPPW
jgi:hypothetical protein